MVLTSRFIDSSRRECFDADIGKDSAREIREYLVPDFSNWKDHDSYQREFKKLLRDLKYAYCSGNGRNDSLRLFQSHSCGQEAKTYQCAVCAFSPFAKARLGAH